MELNEEGQKIVRELGAAINSAIEKSKGVAAAIEHLREIGYELQLTLKLEIGLREIDPRESDDDNEESNYANQDLRLELTDEDLRTLRRMKIRLDPEE